LPASRFNLRMSLADHDRLFIDMLHLLKTKKMSAYSRNLTASVTTPMSTANARKHRARVRDGVYCCPYAL
jgi:hypothetical protein